MLENDRTFFVQAVKNLKKFGPVTNDTVVIIIQVNSNWLFCPTPVSGAEKRGQFSLLNIVVVEYCCCCFVNIRCRKDRAIFS